MQMSPTLLTSMNVQELVRNIRDSQVRIVLVSAGVGGSAIADLMVDPGTSNTLLEARIAYSSRALTDFLGSSSDPSSNPRTARAMAVSAFNRCLELERDRRSSDNHGLPFAGGGCTAEPSEERPKSKPRRICVAIQTADYTTPSCLSLKHADRTRECEERIVTNLILNHIAAAGHVGQSVNISLYKGEEIRTTRTDAMVEWRELLLGRTEAVFHGEISKTRKGDSRVVFPGAFDPLHDGHQRMAKLAQQIMSNEVEFEIAINNVDKSLLDYTEIDRRIQQIIPRHGVWLTRATTFVDKSRIFPDAIFLVGADTIQRIADPTYYGDDSDACLSAIESIASNRCRFLVFGRNGLNGFQSLSDLHLPEKLMKLCQEVGEDHFRADISSTEIKRSL